MARAPFRTCGPGSVSHAGALGTRARKGPRRGGVLPISIEFPPRISLLEGYRAFKTRPEERVLAQKHNVRLRHVGDSLPVCPEHSHSLGPRILGGITACSCGASTLGMFNLSSSLLSRLGHGMAKAPEEAGSWGPRGQVSERRGSPPPRPTRCPRRRTSDASREPRWHTSSG